MLRALLFVPFVLLPLVACVKRTPCHQTLGGNGCSMAPVTMGCTCDGRIVAATRDEQPVACAVVHTCCVGKVTSIGEIPSLGIVWASADAGTDGGAIRVGPP